jgi:microsomal dipeptidase-like Zn-dependent dipeptidase
VQGNVSLQVFATVTKTPRGMNFDRNSGDTDNITLLAIAQRWPPRTWTSLLHRALYQSEKLHAEEAAADGVLKIVRTRAELAAFVDAAPTAGHRVAALLALEGLHPLEGRIEHVDVLFDAGFRMAGITHFFDNELGGSAHGVDKGGLTAFGRDVVRRMEDKRMIVDLAHASPRVIDDVLAMARRPVVVSHTGVQATCPGPRNLSDAHIRAIANNGGVIGVGYFAGAVCKTNAAGIVKAMRHVANLVGVEHVALGSDFDGAVTTAFDTTGVVQITDALLNAGFSEADIAPIMGGNVRRFLLAQLP